MHFVCISVYTQMFGGRRHVVRRRVTHRRGGLSASGGSFWSSLGNIAATYGPRVLKAAIEHGPGVVSTLRGEGRRRVVRRRGGLTAGTRRRVHRRGGVLSGGSESHAARSRAAKLGWSRRRRGV